MLRHHADSLEHVVDVLGLGDVEERAEDPARELLGELLGDVGLALGLDALDQLDDHVARPVLQRLHVPR